MAAIVVRVWMPDRPGALGQVASRIGAVRGDVLGIEILEHGEGRVVDELTVALPDLDLVPLLTAEVDAVDGVSVEDVREVDEDRADPSLVALSAAAALAEREPGARLDQLCTSVAQMLDADWVVVLRTERPIAAVGVAPELEWLLAFLAGSDHLDATDNSAPSDLVWASLLRSGLTLAAGRSHRPIHERERVRVSLFARLADALVGELDQDGVPGPARSGGDRIT